MFKNYFKSAVQSLLQSKVFSFINIAGLTLGLTVSILIGLFVWDENQFDKFLPGAENLYRVYDEYRNNEGTQLMAVSSPMLAPTLQRDFPEVVKTVRVLMRPETKTLFEANGKRLYESSGFYVDSAFFDLFPLLFEFGSPVKVLDDPKSVVISNEMSKRFFNNENPVGQQILIDRHTFFIKAVFTKNPKFHLQFDYVLPLAAGQIPAEAMQRWGWQQFFTYVKLKAGANVRALQLNFQNDVKQKSITPANQVKLTYVPFFQPLNKIHLYSSNFKFDMAQRGNIQYVNTVTIIAAFIMLIACFNFINLATAKSLQRAKEVGVRKSLGASKRQLILQFIGESVLMSVISIIVSVGLAATLLGWLNNFTGKHIPAELLFRPGVLLLFLVLSFMVGVFAGFYPALVLSAFKPAKVLKGNIEGGDQGKTIGLRQVLIVVQFALSVLLIISTLVVFEQTNYLHNKDLGFNKEQILFFPLRGKNISKNISAFKNELLQSRDVSSVSIGYGFPGDAVAGDQIIVPRNGERVPQPASQLMVDYDYVRTLGLELVAGRDFTKAMLTDKDQAFIINQTAVQLLGFKTPQNALGQRLEWNPWGAPPDSFKIGRVIGVVKDFNYKSLYDKMETTVLQIFPDAAWKVAVKLKTAHIENAIVHVKDVWNQFSPEYPLEYKFLDENFAQMYDAEDKLKSLLTIFAGIAIFVGCLGLFGLAAYTAESRKKEVGIRKVLGASTQGVVLLLSKDFIKLVVISLLIAPPFAWYFMHQWLQDFAYRITISWWVFAIAAIAALTIAFVTVSFQAIKAAFANPIKSLKAE